MFYLMNLIVNQTISNLKEIFQHQLEKSVNTGYQL